jgi:hypothetical protein
MLLLIGLALRYTELFLTYLIAPITRILWWIVRTFLVIDQNIYWLLLIFATFALILKILPGRLENSYRTAYSDSVQVEDRVAYWETLLQSAEDQVDGRSILEQELQDLNRSIDALVEGNGQAETVLPQLKTVVPKGHNEMWKSKFRWLSKRDKLLETELERSIDAMLNSMEVKLELNDDRSSNLSSDR